MRFPDRPMLESRGSAVIEVDRSSNLSVAFFRRSGKDESLAEKVKDLRIPRGGAHGDSRVDRALDHLITFSRNSNCYEFMLGSKGIAIGQIPPHGHRSLRITLR